MLKKEDIDIVDICTQPSTHSDIVEKVAASGNHIICEKPMSVRMNEAKKMVDAAKNAGVRLFIVKQNRYNLPIIKIKEALNKGRFGDLFFLNTTIRWNRDQNYYDRDPWRPKKHEGCGVLLNQTSHHLDMMYYLGGEIESVHCKKKTFAHDVEVEDGAVAIFKFKNGAFGTFEGSTCAFPENIEGSISVLGRTGSVKIGGFAMNKVDFWQFNEKEEEDSKIQYLITNPPSVYGFGHLDLLKEVIECIQNNKKSLLEGEKMLESFKIIMAMQKSALENREVKVSEIKDEDEGYYM
jgi:predicted dehydrogenase